MTPVLTADRRTRLARVRALVRKELRQLFRDPKTKRIIFVSPILQLILFGYAVNTDVRHVSTWVVDHDRTPESRLLVDAFSASDYFRVVGTHDDPATLRKALDGGTARVGLWIPPGFAADAKGGRSPAVQILLDGTNSNTATVAQGYAQRIVTEMAVAWAAEGGMAGAAGSAVSGGVDVRARAWFNPSLLSQVYNVPAVCGVIVLLMALLLTAMGVVREREMGTLDQLLVSPLSAGELMLGKILPVAGIALVQLALVTVVALLWFDIPLRGSPAVLLLASVLFILAGLSVGLFISTVSNTQQEAFLSMFLFLLPAIILSGFLYPVETMPDFFQVVTMANPLRHFLEVVRGVFLKGAGIRDMAVPFTILAVMAVGGMAGASRRFKRMLG
ncbi:MAG TPA: ABC transporter permease [Longimicrobiales bacterium]|nr:ABC transporter permease [Longimicrobiales bacterium]